MSRAAALRERLAELAVHRHAHGWLRVQVDNVVVTFLRDETNVRTGNLEGGGELFLVDALADDPQAEIVVMGCYATRAPEEVARLPHVAQVVTDREADPHGQAD